MSEYVTNSQLQISVRLNERRPTRVLHVDNDPHCLKITKQQLEKRGRFQVDSATSLKNATEMLKYGKYDAVISDYEISGNNSLKLLKELRDKGNEIPFIIFTERGREESAAIKALNMSADQYIIKSDDRKAACSRLAIGLKTAIKRKQVAKMLRESEEKYRGLVENCEDSIIISDLKGNILFANKAARRLTGYGEKKTRMNLKEIFLPEDWLKCFQKLKDEPGRGRISPLELMIRRKGGSLVPVESKSQAVFQDGNIVGIKIIMTDISERQKTNDSLRENEQRLRSFFETAPETIYTISAEDGTITSLNPAFEKITGWKTQDWIGKPFKKLVHPDDLPLALETFQKTISGEALPPHELRILSKSGKYLIEEFTSRPQLEKGRVIGEFGIVRDVTERKRTEKTIHENQQKFEGLFIGNPEAAAYLGPDFRILGQPSLRRAFWILPRGDQRKTHR